jgi:hypothetical protein
MAALRTAAMGSAKLRRPGQIEQVEIECAGRGGGRSPTTGSGTARVGLSPRFRWSGTCPLRIAGTRARLSLGIRLATGNRKNQGQSKDGKSRIDREAAQVVFRDAHILPLPS